MTTVPKIPEALKKAVGTYLLARTLAEVTRKEVDAIETEILAEMPPFRATLCGEDGHRITNPRDLYLAEGQDEQMEAYYAETDKRLRAAGIKPDDMADDFCPACVAESLLLDTERLIIETGAPMVGQGDDFADKLLCGKMEHRDKFIDLTVRLVVSLPDFKAPELLAGRS